MFILNGKSDTLCRSLRAFIAVQRLVPVGLVLRVRTDRVAIASCWSRVMCVV
jgi:hypothetical protein